MLTIGYPSFGDDQLSPETVAARSPKTMPNYASAYTSLPVTAPPTRGRAGEPMAPTPYTNCYGTNPPPDCAAVRAACATAFHHDCVEYFPDYVGPGPAAAAITLMRKPWVPWAAGALAVTLVGAIFVSALRH